MYALVTGGSRGLGRAVSVALAKEGYTIIINYRKGQAEAEETLAKVREAGSDGELLPFDVANREEATKALEGWQASHPGEYIAVVVNNAGIRRDNLMVFMPYEDWSQVLRITLDGFYNVTQPLLQPMLVKKWGRIKMRGISRRIFRRIARNREVLALPRAIKVCWQAICTPKIPVAAM